jgi:membrane-associated protease RseP (regulator of RpoE activity)
LPALLFALTAATTLFFGAGWSVGNVQAFALLESALLRGNLADAGRLVVAGLPYSATLLAFFLAHEFGHYLACRFYRIDCTLPHFIPAPTLFGTLGAVIRIRAPFRSRRALFDVGVAGPLAGLVVALPAIAWGILSARVVEPEPLPPGSLTFYFGDSLLTLALQSWLRPDAGPDMVLSVGPIYVAGWLGLLATAMNLSPAGQLDGGHIVYALAPRWHKPLSIAAGLFFASIVATRWLRYEELSVWFAWSLLILLFCRRHPEVPLPEGSLGRTRIVLALLALVVLVLVFMPIPLGFLEG